MPKGIYVREAQIPTCHPDRLHKAKGLCASCYGRLKDRTEYFRKYNKRYAQSAKGKVARRRGQAKYKKTALGRATAKRYEQSALGRATNSRGHKKYDQTPKGLASSRRGSKHWRLRHPEHVTWENMMARCTNPNSFSWKWYGGATPPVLVCKRWLKFENFLADMGPRPQGTSLSRFGDIGNYSPSNTAWHTPKQQAAEAAKKQLRTAQERDNYYAITNS